ncbi:MAG: hypothetical protein WDN07_02720 [Actinomycetota bacterium]
MLVLIVDDHELIRTGLAQAIRGAGHNIVGTAATIAEARATLLFTHQISSLSMSIFLMVLG